MAASIRAGIKVADELVEDIDWGGGAIKSIAKAAAPQAKSFFHKIAQASAEVSAATGVREREVDAAAATGVGSGTCVP